MSDFLEQIRRLIGGGALDQLPEEPGVRPGFGLRGAALQGSDVEDQLRNADRREGAMPMGPKGLNNLVPGQSVAYAKSPYKGWKVSRVLPNGRVEISRPGMFRNALPEELSEIGSTVGRARRARGVDAELEAYWAKKIAEERAQQDALRAAMTPEEIAAERQSIAEIFKPVRRQQIKGATPAAQPAAQPQKTGYEDLFQAVPEEEFKF